MMPRRDGTDHDMGAANRTCGEVYMLAFNAEFARPYGAADCPWTECFFALLTEKRIRRRVFTSVPQLERCLREYMKTHNENPKPLVWTKWVAQIMEKVDRGRAAADEMPTAA